LKEKDNSLKFKATKLKDLDKTKLIDEVLWLELAWVVHWDENRYFNPYQEITRAEFFAILLDSHCYDIKSADVNIIPFKDVDKKSWQAKVVAKAYEIGLLHGYDDGTVRPNDIISKAEALWVLYWLRILEVGEWRIQKLNYEDVKVNWEENLVKDLETLWIIDSNFDKKKFHPDDWVDREFMVNYLIKTMRLY
jgi:hypothetical protein